MSSTIRGGQFIVKDATIEQIFIPEEFSEEQKMMLQSAQEFIDKEVVPKKDRLEKKDYQLTHQLMQQLGEMGFLGVSVPEEYGGMGMDFVSTMLVCDYVSGATGSLATAFGAHTGIGTMPILLYGTEEQKKKYLPKLSTGEWFASYCLTEPGAGSDANAGKSTAKLSDDGKHYIINAQKIWISNAGFAELFIVFAKIDNDKNLTAFLVEKSEAGDALTLGEEEPKLGIHSSSTRQVFCNDLKVPVENLLGERDKGFKIALNALNVGRIKLAAACLDAQRRVINLAVDYAKERKQFKTPIAEFGAIKKKVAEMATICFASESGTYRAAKDIADAIQRNLDSGKNLQEAELKGVEEYAIEASILKIFSSEAIQTVSDEGIQIYGGMGYSAEMPMEAAWRDARISRIYEGTNEINRMLSIDMLIRKAMKGHVDLLQPAQAVGEELLGMPSFDSPDFSAPLSMELEMVKNLKKVFLMVAGSAVQKFGTELEKHQQLLLVASNLLIEVYIAESTILRAKKLIEKEVNPYSEIAVKMAKIQLFHSVETIKKEATEGIVSFAENDEQTMMLSGLRRFAKYFEHPNVINLKKDVAEYYYSR